MPDARLQRTRRAYHTPEDAARLQREPQILFTPAPGIYELPAEWTEHYIAPPAEPSDDDLWGV